MAIFRTVVALLIAVAIVGAIGAYVSGVDRGQRCADQQTVEACDG